MLIVVSKSIITEVSIQWVTAGTVVMRSADLALAGAQPADQLGDLALATVEVVLVVGRKRPHARVRARRVDEHRRLDCGEDQPGSIEPIAHHALRLVDVGAALQVDRRDVVRERRATDACSPSPP